MPRSLPKRPVPDKYRHFLVRLSQENYAALRRYAVEHNLTYQEVMENGFELLMARNEQDRKRAYDPLFYDATGAETRVLRSVLNALREADPEVVDMLHAVLRFAETERRARRRTQPAKPRKNRAA